MLRAPIKAPWNVVSMVCLESAILDAPSLFTDSLIDDPSNQFLRFVNIGATSGVNPVVFDYYNKAQVSTETYPRDVDRTNAISMKDMLRKCVGVSLSRIDEVAKFLCDWIFTMKSFRLYFGGFYKNGDTIIYYTPPGEPGPMYIEWCNGLRSGYLGGNVSGDANNPTASANPATWQQVRDVLLRLGSVTFTLIPLPSLSGDLVVTTYVAATTTTPATIPSTYPYTTSYRVSGRWLKLFGINPFLYDGCVQPKNFITISSTQPLLCNLQNEGYNMLYLHSNFAKSVSAASSALDNNYIVPTNILWPIQIVSNPGQKTYFVNYNTAGKVSYFMPIMEEIEIYFTDEWGDRLTDYIDCQLVLTFDFAPAEPLPEPNTIKRARRELNM